MRVASRKEVMLQQEEMRQASMGAGVKKVLAWADKVAEAIGSKPLDKLTMNDIGQGIAALGAALLVQSDQVPVQRRMAMFGHPASETPDLGMRAFAAKEIFSVGGYMYCTLNTAENVTFTRTNNGFSDGANTLKVSSTLKRMVERLERVKTGIATVQISIDGKSLSFQTSVDGSVESPDQVLTFQGLRKVQGSVLSHGRSGLPISERFVGLALQAVQLWVSKSANSVDRGVDEFLNKYGRWLPGEESLEVKVDLSSFSWEINGYRYDQVNDTFIGQSGVEVEGCTSLTALQSRVPFLTGGLVELRVKEMSPGRVLATSARFKVVLPLGQVN